MTVPKKDHSAHHFDFKRWVLHGHDKKSENIEYPEDYPTEQDCYPDPENEFEVEGDPNGY